MFLSVKSSFPNLSYITLLQYLNANTLKIKRGIPYLQRILWKSNHNNNLKYRMNTFSGKTEYEPNKLIYHASEVSFLVDDLLNSSLASVFRTGGLKVFPTNIFCHLSCSVMISTQATMLVIPELEKSGC